MVKDLVCNMIIDKSEAAASHVYNGMRYYFCCKFCLVLFVEDPDRFISKTKENNTRKETNPSKKQ